jgi:hypothetical protein
MRVCPVCYHPVSVKPHAKEGRCSRHRPKAHKRKPPRELTDLELLMERPDNLGGGR